MRLVIGFARIGERCSAIFLVFFFRTRAYEGTHEESDQSLSAREPLSLRSGASERLCLISRRGRIQKKE